jgi:outer membrane autotransporter protein
MTGSGDGALSLGFSTSLRDVYRYAADREANKLGYLGIAQGYGASVKPIVNPFDIWIEAKYAGFRDNQFRSNDLDGHFGIVTVGADYVMNRNLLVGAFVQFDTMQQRSNSLATDVQGHGWMAGPYATLRLSENVFLQGRAAWGSSSNTVSPFLTYTDSFDSDRWLVSGTLSGRWSFGPWTFKPSASISYIEDSAQAYRDTFGVLIPGVTSSLGQAKAGPEFSYKFNNPNGGFVEPHAGAQLIWNFAGDTTAAGLGAIDGNSSGPSGVRGRVELGVKMGAPSGMALDLSGSYDGIGTSGYDAVTGRATLSIPLN